MGKSRIIALSALLTLQWVECSVVHLVFSSQSLASRDQDEFADYWILSGLQNRVEYHSNLQFSPSLTDIVVIDESDVFIYADPEKFDLVLSDARCICLTATVSDPKDGRLEREVLSDLGFKHFFYWPPALPKPIPVIFDRVTETLELNQIAELIKNKARERAVIVYGDSDLLDFLSSQMLEKIDVDENIDYRVLRALDFRNSERQYPVLMVKESHFMRGHDFRASVAGIVLIVARDYPTHRDLEQGLSRVGRWKDKSERILIGGFAPVCQVGLGEPDCGAPNCLQKF